MNHQQMLDVLVNNLIPARERPMLWSPPGMGKTALASQARQKLSDLTGEEWDLHCWDMTYLYDPADSRGIPTVVTNADGRRVTQWVPPEHMVIDGKPTLILLDDLPTLPQTSQASCYRLLQHGEIGGIQFGKNVFFLGAGNRMGDSSATNAMPFALANRLIHLNLTYTLKGWCQWALANGVATEVVAFHRFTQGTSLYPIYNDSETTDAECGLCKQKVAPNAICSHCIRRSRALPTLRSWGDGVSSLLLTRPDPNIEVELYAGKVGREKATEFCGYLRMYRQIPSIDSILMGPNAAPVPKEPSVLYAVSTALGRVATSVNMDAVAAYTERMPAEFNVLTMHDAVTRDAGLTQTRAYQVWATKNQDVLN